MVDAVYVVQSLLDAASQCGDGWSHHNGNCYYASHDERDQTSARSRCQMSGSGVDLVSIRDEDELNFVKAMLYVTDAADCSTAVDSFMSLHNACAILKDF